MKTFLYIFAIGFLFSCQGKNVSVKKKENSQQQVITVHANSQVEFEVEGMVCQMGCGGSMRKELKKTGAVERVEVDFEDNKKVQLVTVSYDSTLIKAEKIGAILNTMNDKQFTATRISKKSI